MRRGLCTIVLLTILTTAASADELILTNGDRVQGQAGDQNNDSLIWHSENFGPLTIPLEKVSMVNGSPIAAAKVASASSFSNTYTGAVSATGAYASGNEEREDWDIEGSVEWREGDFRHHSGINYESHSLDNSPANEEYRLDYGIDWFFQDKWYWNNGLFWGGNDNRAIDQHYALGSAIGRQFWDQESGALSAETGLLWVSEEFEDQSSDNRLTWSWAADYRQMITPSLELFHSHSLRVSVSDLDDLELRADLGLKAPLIQDIFTELKLEWIYDNQPVEGTEPSDTQLTIGVSYSW